ncbi:transcriptional regulator, LysR family [Amphritea atlantica]|uniref:Transcriptional regulator, LysR family n=1 Tax=Amphritea atlantica TaxID=355243 RepID=A0A1H9FH27_9GAMM|nr:LysR family transcriptional regulator [Amphritea atlantica]SEQ36753.1 transcriptional regulator, LysR family [Amphritea atlantica]
MNTSDLSLFIRIAETGSITESAKQLGITTAAASSALKRLERQLDIQLFIRTTRQLRITTQGEKFLYHCRRALESLEQGQVSAHETMENVTGELRFSAPSDLGRNLLFHWVNEMMDIYPSLSIDLNVSDSLSNFFLDQVDVALRYGKPEDSSMVAFHIATIKRITCAAPSYLENNGTPSHPNELSKHNCLLYRLNGRLFNDWEYQKKSENVRVKVGSNRISNDTDIVRRWVVEGKGIAYRSLLDISSDLDKGRLVQLFDDFESPPAELYLLCPDRKQVTPGVIAFREMLREKCSQILEV